METTTRTPTEQQFEALNKAYQYFNKVLFGGKLQGCILNFSRKKNTHGFMAPERWRKVGEENYSTHEISLTPYTLYREPILVFGTLVHEQCHLWQWDHGQPSRSGYHNKEWAEKMKEIGLQPSDTGMPGGKETGQSVSHYIIEGGAYEKAFLEMPSEYTLPFASLEGDLMGALINGTMSPPEGTTGTNGTEKPVKVASAKDKKKYTCPSCKINVWGKPNLELLCKVCSVDLEVN